MSCGNSEVDRKDKTSNSTLLALIPTCLEAGMRTFNYQIPYWAGSFDTDSSDIAKIAFIHSVS